MIDNHYYYKKKRRNNKTRNDHLDKKLKINNRNLTISDYQADTKVYKHKSDFGLDLFRDARSQSQTKKKSNA
jgi:hypothetical protein